MLPKPSPSLPPLPMMDASHEGTGVTPWLQGQEPPMRYNLNEGTFELPKNTQDRTVNVLILSDAPAGLSLVVNRDRLEPGENFEGFIKRQLHTVSRQVRQFQEHARRNVKVGASQLTGLQLDSSFKQNGQTFHQLQTVFQLPSGLILVTTLTSAIPLTQEHRTLAQRILDSFVPAVSGAV